MRALTINELADTHLKVYMNKDGTFEATRNGRLYTFLWSPRTYKVYNFKKLGTIKDDFNISGKLIKEPHIQLILQLQNKISKN